MQCVSVSKHVWVGAVDLGVGVGSYQPGVYVPLKALFLVYFKNTYKVVLKCTHNLRFKAK